MACLSQGSWYCEEDLYSKVDISNQTEKTEGKMVESVNEGEES